MTETPGCRNRRWEATHRRIFAVALDLFEDLGFDKVSVGQIAGSAGVSVPTFYAHYPSKEHVVMALPTAEQVRALLASQPAGLPAAERVRRMVSENLAHMPPEEEEHLLRRWRLIAGHPLLRIRAAEFERATAGLTLEALPSVTGAAATPAEVVQVGAQLAAYTAGLLAWADSDGERTLDETLDEAFRALSG
ncbi:TetR family transcriptional regulator [Blastococcus sp. SYSU D01042]